MKLALKIISAIILLLFLMFCASKLYDYIYLAPKGQTYIAPIAGVRYHTHKNCKGLRKAARIELVSMEEAVELGLTICSYCERRMR